MTFRLLRSEEYHKVYHIFEEQQASFLPDPYNTIAILVAEENKEIIGMIRLEAVLHAGCLWVAETYRNKGLATHLVNSMAEGCFDKAPNTGFYSFPSNEVSKKVMEKAGLIKMNWEVWKKEF